MSRFQRTSQEARRAVIFNVQNSSDMLRKLRWEIYQISSQRANLDASVYHSINGAITAWHLHEWIWNDIKRDYGRRVVLAKRAGIASSRLTMRQFGVWATQENRGVRLSQMIATEAKHFAFEIRAQGMPVTTTDVSASSTTALTFDGIPDLDSVINVDKLEYRVWVPKVVIDSQRIPIKDILEDALEFWTKESEQARSA